MKKGDIREKIRAFQGDLADDLNRYRSWEHCYGYFHKTTPEDIAADRNHAALQLGFYLASWGIYRGSSFLLKYDYTVHLRVIDQLVSPRFCRLWKEEFGARADDMELVPIIADAVDAIREAYRHFAEAAEAGPASDTLVTKVVLGTFGCLPACDWYATQGLRNAGLEYSSVNPKFVEGVLLFCRNNRRDLQKEQTRIERTAGMRYPLMKLVDMYLWQTGHEDE